MIGRQLAVPLVAATVLTAAAASRAEQASTFASEVDVTAVRVNLIALDPEGEPVFDLTRDELEVFEDGEPARILNLEPGQQPVRDDQQQPEMPQRTPWRVVAYIAPELSGATHLPRVLAAAAEQTDRLTSLGPVDLVVADPEPQLIREAVRDPAELSEAFLHIAANVSGRAEIENIRNRFATNFARGAASQDYDYFETENQQIGSRWTPTMILFRASTMIRQEMTVVRGQLDRLTWWLQTQPSPRRGLLLWMTGGFDLNPSEFYIPFVAQRDHSLANAMQIEFLSQNLSNDVKRLIEAALAQGWTVLPINSAQMNTFLKDASMHGVSVGQHFMGEAVNTIEAQQSNFTMIAPMYPLEVAAQATGGELVRRDDTFQQAIERAQSAYLLTFQVSRPADGNTHRLQVRCTRAGVEVRTPTSVTSGTPEGAAAARALHLLATGATPADRATAAELPVDIHLDNVRKAGSKQTIGHLEVAIDLHDLLDLIDRPGAGRVRLTIAVDIKDRPPFIHHSVSTVERTGEGETWLYSAPLKWPANARQLAVVVEELTSGAWGAARLALPDPD